MIVAVGLSHREAPIEVRERLALEAAAIPGLLAELRARASVREAACVSTCNRIEVYAVAAGGSDDQLGAAADDVARALVAIGAKNGAADVGKHLSVRRGNEAVRHLFRVASSLDSLVVGEPQILGQVKDAFELSRSSGALGPLLERAMSRALHVAKRVRTETAIGAGQVSVSSVAADLARQIFGDLSGRTAMLLGAGEMAEAAAKHLVKAGARIVVVNRSPERAAELAAQFGGAHRSLPELAACLVEADVVIASTSARGFVIDRELVKGTARARRGRSLFFIDIAVPRDVDPAVNGLDNVYLYDIDDLSHLVAESMRGRQAEAERAEAIVAHEARTFETWAEQLNVTPTIVALRGKVRATLAAELDKSLATKLKHLPEPDRKALGAMLDAAVNKLLHGPVTHLKSVAADARGEELVQAVHLLFDLPQLAHGDEDGPSPDHSAEPAGAAAQGVAGAAADGVAGVAAEGEPNAR